MANELQASVGQTGLTVYFLVFNATGQVYNGSSYVSYVAANYTTYAVSSSALGSSGIYAGNMPTSSAGVYSLIARKQSGGSPAESDTDVAEGTLFWDGSTSAIALSSAGLDQVLIESGITASASLVNDAATQLTAINARQALALIQAISAGLLSGVSGNAPVFKAAGKSSVTRLSGTNDASDDRTAATITVPT